jgi:ABC-type branched-subunit amino acid transport system ATPase component
VTALDNFSCKVNVGEIFGLIGPNGAGKTTLFNVITGFLKPENGNVFFKNKDITENPPYRIRRAGISRTFQKIRLIRQISVLDNVLLSFPDQSGEYLRTLFFKPAKWKTIENDNEKEALDLLEYAGLDEKTDVPASDLSYGQQKLLSIVCCLAADPEILLLDEPVAGLNPNMIEKILNIVKEQAKNGKTILFIEHNIDAVMQICDRVVFMDMGRLISEGPPSKVRQDPNVIEAYLD